MSTRSYWRMTVLVCAAGVAAAVPFAADPIAADERQAGARQAAPPASRGASLKPLTDAASLAQGRALYEGQTYMCANCHRPDLGGLVGPNLVDDFWTSGCSVTDVMTATEKGFPARGMMPFGSGKPMTSQQLHQLASYILSKRGSAPANAKTHDPARDKPCK
ncbi:MAG: c-type cytochrome [Acidobacteria bacterium]|nr:c-type cytochrome [Acidobacteriota bacterium]